MSGRVVGPRERAGAAGTGRSAVKAGPRTLGRGLGSGDEALMLVATQQVVLTLAVVIASVAYAPFFVDDSFLLPVAGAAVLGTLSGVAIVHRRRPPGLAWALTVVAFALYCVYVLFPRSTSSGLPGLSALTAVGDGLLGGLARMLTVTPPADVQGELLILPVTLAFAAALTGTLCRAGHSMLLPVLPPLLVFVAALLLSANAPEFRWRTTLALLGCLLVIVLLRANPVTDGGAAPGPAGAGARPPWRATGSRLLFGVPVIVAVALLAITATGVLPVANGDQRYDPRASRQAPLDIRDQLNPLVGVREQLLLPAPVEVLTVRAQDGAPIPFDRIRTAALDTYDGVQWRSTSRFVRTGSTLPAGPALTDPALLTVDVSLTGALPSPFLAEFGRPVTITASQVGFDPTTGLLATVAPTLDGYRYTLTGQYVVADPPPDATPDPGGALTQLPELAGDPAGQFRTLAQQWSAGLVYPYQQLTAIADRLRRDYRYALDAAPGHSFAALNRFVAPTDATVDHRVTEEQTAAAFVIMARSLGYPARVAVGYRLDPQRTVNGTVTVTSQDADAWAEVAFAGRGWVPFQVTPPRDGDPPPPPPITPEGTDLGTVSQQPPPGTNAGSGPADATTVGKAVSWAIAIAVLLPLLLLIAIIGAIVGAKQWRRKRRIANGAAADRIVGAWQEATDRLTEHGMAVSPHLTPTDIARQAAERFGDDAGRQLAVLAPIVSQALYARDDPDEAVVATAWDLESELRAILDSRRPWWAAARSWVDPRPLWRGRRRLPPRHRADRPEPPPPAGPPPAEPTRAAPHPEQPLPVGTAP